MLAKKNIVISTHSIVQRMYTYSSHIVETFSVLSSSSNSSCKENNKIISTEDAL